jgi:hypothetical protein
MRQKAAEDYSRMSTEEDIAELAKLGVEVKLPLSGTPGYDDAD